MRMLVARAVLIISVLVSCVLIAGCSSPPKQTTGTPAAKSTTSAVPTTAAIKTSPAATTSKPSATMPSTVSIVAGGVSGTQYMLGSALAPVLEKAIGAKVRVTPVEVVRDRFVAMQKKDVELAIETFANTGLAMEAAEAYAGDGTYKMRNIWFLFDSPTGYLVRGDDKRINSIRDIVGKRVAWAPFSSGFIASYNGLFDFLQITKEDVTLVPFSDVGSMYKSVGEGKSDISSCVLSSTAAYETAAMPHGVKVITLEGDKEAWARYYRWRPCDRSITATEGIAECIGKKVLSSPYGIVSTQDANEEVIYRITKALWEKADEYKVLHKYLQTGIPETQREWLDTCPYPVHPGAIRLFKEKGVWTAKDDVWNNELLAREKQFQDAWDATVKKAQAQGIKIANNNQEWLTLWGEATSKLERFHVR